MQLAFKIIRNNNGVKSTETQTEKVQYKQNSDNQTLVFGKSDNSNNKMKPYYVQPIFNNVGDKVITFNFPSPNGQIINLQPRQTAYIPTSVESSQQPSDMTITFLEGDSTYNYVFPWSSTPNNITLNLGNGKAVEVPGDSSGSGGSCKFCY